MLLKKAKRNWSKAKLRKKKTQRNILSAETQINSHSSGFKDSPSLMYKKGQLKVGSLVYSVVVLNDKAPIDGKNNQQFPQQDY